MADWPKMNRLERDLTVIAAGAVTVATAIGAAVGWVAHQLFEHLHTESRSDHRR